MLQVEWAAGEAAPVVEVTSRFRTRDRLVDPARRSADAQKLSAEERAQLTAFLATLSSDDPPRPAALPAKTQALGAPADRAVATAEVRQRDRRDQAHPDEEDERPRREGDREDAADRALEEVPSRRVPEDQREGAVELPVELR